MQPRIGPLVLIIVGVLFLLSNLGILQLRAVLDGLGTWWPVILIAVGLAGLVKKRS
jgi:hypothetical protein